MAVRWTTTPQGSPGSGVVALRRGRGRRLGRRGAPSASSWECRPGPAVVAAAQPDRLVERGGDARLEVGDPLVGLGLREPAVGDGLVQARLRRGDQGVDELVAADVVGLGELTEGGPGLGGGPQLLGGDAERPRARGASALADRRPGRRAAVPAAERPALGERGGDLVGLRLGERAVGDQAGERLRERGDAVLEGGAVARGGVRDGGSDQRRTGDTGQPDDAGQGEGGERRCAWRSSSVGRAGRPAVLRSRVGAVLARSRDGPVTGLGARPLSRRRGRRTTKRRPRPRARCRRRRCRRARPRSPRRSTGRDRCRRSSSPVRVRDASAR